MKVGDYYIKLAGADKGHVARITDILDKTTAYKFLAPVPMGPGSHQVIGGTDYTGTFNNSNSWRKLTEDEVFLELI